MLALRLTRVAHPAVQLRRLTVTAASAGTGFLLLSSLGHALGHADDPSAALLRLSWCLLPLAATLHLAVAVARTDPGTRPRGGLSALGLGPARMMAVSAATTALTCAFGCLLALLAFLHLRGDLTGVAPFAGAGPEFLARHKRLPVAGTLTLLAVVPVLASAAVALALRPREQRAPAGERTRPARRSAPAPAPVPASASVPVGGSGGGGGDEQVTDGAPAPRTITTGPDGTDTGTGTDADAAGDADPGTEPDAADPHRPLPPRRPPAGLPWGIAVLAAGFTVEAYAGRTPGAATAPGVTLPGGLAPDSAPVLVGWLLTALGLALAGPGLTHLCGRLLQAVRPGAVRLLAGRVLMEEAGRVGRPLGVTCAVASGAYAVAVPYQGPMPSPGPLTVLGALLVAGCAVAALFSAAVEARQDRSGTIAALRRLGAPATVLRTAAALRAGALLALFVPLTLAIAHLAALPLAR
ncbi:hypothetical protein ABZ858_32815 [Streptomyces sp. NPDC047017]|uniref:hypothetical protein n=1 Tax=Streptomyces sp. NPDC047017 TaxID=3155024 RepID=UPI0033DB4B75